MGQKTTILAIGLIIFAVILAILFVVSRVVGGIGNNSSNNESSISTANENIVSVAKIVSTPIVYEGYNLTVESDISGWTTNRSFYFNAQSGGFLGGNSKGLLLAIDDLSYQLPENSTDGRVGLGATTDVTAKGTIRILNREELQSALGVNFEDPKVALNNPVLTNWNLGPVLIITEIKTTNK